jgi:hypothetical protein
MAHCLLAWWLRPKPKKQKTLMIGELFKAAIFFFFFLFFVFRNASRKINSDLRSGE